MVMIFEVNKLYLGNCLEIMKTFPDNCIDLTITSPPYNMRTRVMRGKYITREKTDHFSKKYAHFGDDLSIDDFYNFHKKCIEEMLRISKLIFYNIGIVTGSKEAFFKLIGDFNKDIKDIIIWDKGYGQPAMHNNVINRATEIILVFQSPATIGRAFEKAYFKRGEMDDIWRIKRPKSVKGHGATFPIELVEKAINGWSKEGDIIFDPFSGTGTTLVVAKKNNRNYIGIEISKEYYDIIQNRLEQY